MDVAEIVDLAAEHGLDDRESLVSFALGFASGASECDASEPVKVYGSPQAVPVVGILAFMFDAEIPLNFQMVHVLQDEHLRPDFAAMNPYRVVPVIDHGGYILHESSAIMRYLCRAFPRATSKFYGHGDIQVQGFIDAALDERQLTLGAAAKKLTLPAFGFAPKLSDEEAAKALEKLNARLELFCTHFLKHGKFVGGDHPSIADYSIVPVILGLRAVPDIFESLNESFLAYIGEFEEACPGWQKAIDAATNGIGIGFKQFLEKRAATYSKTVPGSFNNGD